MPRENRDLSATNLVVLLLKHVISRMLFLAFSFAAVWRVTKIKQNTTYWYLLLTLAPLILEMIYALCSRKPIEHKWVSPDVVCFLLCIIPCIWILETELFDQRIAKTITSTGPPVLVITTRPPVFKTNDSDIFSTLDYIIRYGTDGEWTLGLEQTLIFILVSSKWIAPKGLISHDALSQLLLLYITSGVDIVELFGAFDDVRVRTSYRLVIATLVLWSWSLIQFTLHLTSIKKPQVLEEDLDKVIALSNFFKYVNTDDEDVHNSAWVKLNEEIGKGNLRVNKISEKNKGIAADLNDKDEDWQDSLSCNETKGCFPFPSGVRKKYSLNSKLNGQSVQSDFRDFQLKPCEYDCISYDVNTESSFTFPCPSGVGKEPNRLIQGKEKDSINFSRRHSQSDRNTTEKISPKVSPKVSPSISQPTYLSKIFASKPSRKSSSSNDTDFDSGDSDSSEEKLQLEFSSTNNRRSSVLILVPNKDSKVGEAFKVLQDDGVAVEPSTFFSNLEEYVDASWFCGLKKNQMMQLDCFCFYNEIWGLIANLVLQDVPFMMIRLTILLYYQIITRLIILFLFKNFFVVVLNLNRIRAIIKSERRAWLKFHEKLNAQADVRRSLVDD